MPPGLFTAGMLPIIPLLADVIVLWGAFVADWTPQTIGGS